jgi:uncharacterized membrane protein
MQILLALLPPLLPLAVVVYFWKSVDGFWQTAGLIFGAYTIVPMIMWLVVLAVLVVTGGITSTIVRIVPRRLR